MRDVDLQVGTGKTLVNKGLSGSNKSSLPRCMSWLTRATAGEILFYSANLLLTTSKQLIDIRRHELGVVFHNFGPLPPPQRARKRRLLTRSARKPPCRSKIKTVRYLVLLYAGLQ